MLEVVGISIPIFWLWSVLNFLLIYLLDITETEICACILSSTTDLYSVGSPEYFTLSTHIRIERIGIDKNRFCVVAFPRFGVHNNRIEMLVSASKPSMEISKDYWLPCRGLFCPMDFSIDRPGFDADNYRISKLRSILLGDIQEKDITLPVTDLCLDNASLKGCSGSFYRQLPRAHRRILALSRYAEIIRSMGIRSRNRSIINSILRNYRSCVLFLAGAQESYNREHHHEQSKDWNSEFFHLFNFLLWVIPWMERYQLCVVVR